MLEQRKTYQLINYGVRKIKLMRKTRILWTDDEIAVLKSHIIFLTEKGYEIDTCSNGNDTIDLIKKNNYDLLFLDENMPGLSGIETLKIIKEIKPEIPIIMITKSEAEEIMEAAIGSEIADYLIKPVKPNQILLTIKKNLDQKRLITEKTTTGYQQEFGRIDDMISNARTFNDWTELFKKLVFWETELEKSTDPGMIEILYAQEIAANNSFSKFISSNYLSWFNADNADKPLLSPALLAKKVFPEVKDKRPVFFILIDNLRFDQWKTISAELTDLFRITGEDLYFSILPTATQYSRNSIFAGLMPSAIAETMPELWKNDDDDEGKNNSEDKLLERQLGRTGLKYDWTYEKIGSNLEGKKVIDKVKSLLKNDLNVLVYNFVDMLSHARTEVGLIRDLANNERAYRSLTRSWFIHSTLFDLLKLLSKQKVKIIITTDHGTVRVQNPVKIVGDRQTSSNLRYKTGKNLDYDSTSVFEIKNPEKAHLPKANLSSRYIFATNQDFLVYPNNYNYFANYYRDTFQHGGISMHEMMIPVITLEPLS
jgi:CheY-like chemotaxis protein